MQRMTRRAFASLGVGLLAAAAGCGPAASPSGSTSAPTQAPSQSAPQGAPQATAAPAKPAAQATAAPPAAQATAAPPAAQATAAKPVAASNPPTSPEMVDAIDLKGKKVEVVYWHNRPQKDQDLLQSMFDEFNKTNPYGITARAEIAGASYPDVYNKVSAAIQAGQPPEMSVAYQNQAAFYRAQGAIIDLSPFINSKTYGLSADDKKDYFQTFLDSDANPQFQGERLGFPTQRSLEVMYYNADWLRQLGYEQPPKDWKTWEEAAGKASDAGQSKYGWAFRHDASNFASQVFSRGGRILSTDGTKYVFNDEAGVDTAAMVQRLFKNKCAVEIPPSERNGEQNRFANGQVLFVFASSSGMPFYQDAVGKGGKFKWDIALLPNTGKPAVNLYGASLSIYKTTPEKELASWLVVKYLGEKEQTAKWAINTGYLPVRQSAKDEVVKAYKADPKWGAAADSYAKMFDWIQYAMVESPVAGYDPVRDIIDKEMLTPLTTNFSLDPKKVVDEAAAKANTILQENAPKR
ncbi:MAG: extracellular solute-binding protein [Chloroflexi bacterium]|nr:extracellular solute-binding protein [Chloroflexota bacterium]